MCSVLITGIVFFVFLHFKTKQTSHDDGGMPLFTVTLYAKMFIW
jgi:hypothetical protein